MKTISVNVNTIDIPERHRRFDPAKVGPLAESMRTIGLQQPISVWVDHDPETGELDVVLVAGRHRVEAARRLGWADIDAVEVELDATDREIWEISENLHRVGLTLQERDQHIRRYAELLEKRREQEQVISRQDDAKPKPVGRPAGVARLIAEETGLSKRTVERALAPERPKQAAPKPKQDWRDDRPLAALQVAAKHSGLVTIPDDMPADVRKELADDLATLEANAAKLRSQLIATAPGFKSATHLIGAVRRFAEFCGENSPQKVAKGLLPGEAKVLIEAVFTIGSWNAKFLDALEGRDDG
ncbi:MAG: ParB/RepB/Spo0J family partition protein [Kiloniellaceae bacterium]